MKSVVYSLKVKVPWVAEVTGLNPLTKVNTEFPDKALVVVAHVLPVQCFPLVVLKIAPAICGVPSECTADASKLTLYLVFGSRSRKFFGV